jgi:hypothetical protein
VSPFMGHEQLYTHWQRGVLPWDTYVQHACAQACLPHQEMPEPTTQTREDNSVNEDATARRNRKSETKSDDTKSDDEEDN